MTNINRPPCNRPPVRCTGHILVLKHLIYEYLYLYALQFQLFHLTWDCILWLTYHNSQSQPAKFGFHLYGDEYGAIWASLCKWVCGAYSMYIYGRINMCVTVLAKLKVITFGDMKSVKKSHIEYQVVILTLLKMS
jgi:hypothetical protein